MPQNICNRFLWMRRLLIANGCEMQSAPFSNPTPIIVQPRFTRLWVVRWHIVSITLMSFCLFPASMLRR